MTKLDWTLDADASCWHAVLAAASGRRLIDPALGEELRRLAGDTKIPEAVPGEGDLHAEAINYSRHKLIADGGGPVVDQLRLRIGPLRQLWDARGPGLMRQASRLIQSTDAPPVARVFPVLPVCGGGGLAFPKSHAVTIEAVLTNPVESLPEVLRLGWLLTQLATPDPATTRQVAAACVVLAAAEEVELAKLDAATLTLAAETWGVNAPQPIDQMLSWWHDYQRSPTPWAAAVEILAKRYSS